ncbi:MAG: hypothetical protein WC465_02740 [Patescibacteria group bacterium]
MKNKNIILRLIIFGCLLAGTVLAAEETQGIPFIPSITIPGSDIFKASSSMIVGPETLANYINAIYKAGGILAGAVALFMLVYAGWQWLFAAGNSGKINQAQETIRMTLIGLAFLFGGYLLLSLISENLVNFKSLEIKKPTMVTYAVCTKDADCAGGYICMQKTYVKTSDPAEDGRQCGALAAYISDPCGQTNNHAGYDYVGKSKDCSCKQGPATEKLECEFVPFNSQTNVADYCRMIRLDIGVEDGCGAYSVRDACRNNVCLNQTMANDATFSTICGINNEDYNRSTEYVWGCKDIESVSCSSNSDCLTGGKGEYCCVNLGFIHRCRSRSDPYYGSHCLPD